MRFLANLGAEALGFSALISITGMDVLALSQGLAGVEAWNHGRMQLHANSAWLFQFEAP